jgi:pimeloyl-ACP methyl ester carboxylesterase
VPEASVVTYPGARRPDRQRTVDSSGLGIAVHEWGDEGAPPLLLAHGGFDFAGTYDVFAPLLAEAGWRVVAWDHRGHGDSEHAHLYSWDADVRDAVAVMDSVTRGPVPIIGHSKGGALMLQLAEALPHRMTRLVNIDGMPSPRPHPHPDVASHDRTKLMQNELSGWLDYRRSTSTLTRKPGTLDDMAERRGRMNPRLSKEWLRYLVTIGAREDADGWRWKIDPALRMGGFGPYRNSWSLERLAGMETPILGLLGLIPEQMGWGTHPDELRPYLPPGGELVAFEDAGHFVHIEKPHEVATLVLDFLGSPA